MDVLLKTYSSLAKILPQSAPYTPVTHGVALKNESFSFQADLYLQPTTALFQTCRFSVTGSLAKYVTLSEVVYVPVIKGHYPTSDDFLT